MTTWKSGRRLIAERMTARAIPLDQFMAAVVSHPPLRVSGTAVFMTAQVPSVPEAEQVTVEPLGHGIFNVRGRYGFMQDLDVPQALALARAQGADIDADDVTFFLGRETIIPTRRRGMALWRERLFVLMSRSARPPSSAFPPSASSSSAFRSRSKPPLPTCTVGTASPG